MSNELMNMDSLDVMVKQANILIKSGFLPNSISTPEKAITIMMKGNELNIPTLEALSGINIIQGKPTVAPQLMLGMARRTGQLEDMKIEYDKEGTCHITIKRKGQTAHTETFGDKEAKDMGLANKDNYKKQAKVMYKWRALSANLRVTFADVISGMYIHEELNPDLEFNSEGEVNNLKSALREKVDSYGDEKKKGLPQPEPIEDFPFNKKEHGNKVEVYIITESNRQKLSDQAKKYNVSAKAMTKMIKHYGFDSSKLITVDKYDEIYDQIEGMGELIKGDK